MTVSMFDSYLERMHLHRTERIMDMSQASLYAQLTNDARRRLWNNWTSLITTINNQMIFNDAKLNNQNPITWNGQTLSIRNLVRRFAATFGKGGVVN